MHTSTPPADEQPPPTPPALVPRLRALTRKLFPQERRSFITDATTNSRKRAIISIAFRKGLCMCLLPPSHFPHTYDVRPWKKRSYVVFPTPPPPVVFFSVHAVLSSTFFALALVRSRGAKHSPHHSSAQSVQISL